MSGFAEFLASQMGSEGPRAETVPILPEAAIMRLREAAACYAEQMKDARFKVGQIVTPWKGNHFRDQGSPHIVVEVKPLAAPYFSGHEVSGVEFGPRLDMRVLKLAGNGSSVAPFWVESFCFELYAGEGL